MSAAKHPVSFLQEFMVKEYCSMPIYEISQGNNGFICKVTTNYKGTIMETIGTGTSKQMAKLEAAGKAVDKLFGKPSVDTDITDFIDKMECLKISTVSSKHPVSELQELMAQRNRPLPNYSFEQISANLFPMFRCTLRVDNSVFISEAPNKPTAKKVAAEEALNVIRETSRSASPSRVVHVPTIFEHKDVGFDAVSHLNLRTQANHFSTPKYTEMGNNEKGEFVILCEAAGYKTKGSAISKKSAKQEAAKNLLLLMKSRDSPVEESFHSDEEIVKKFNSLTTNHIVPQKDEIEIKFTSSTRTKDEPEPETEEDLLNYLKTRNILFTTEIISTKPLCSMCLTISDGNHTVLSTGSTEKEAYLKLLKEACKVVENLA